MRTGFLVVFLLAGALFLYGCTQPYNTAAGTPTVSTEEQPTATPTGKPTAAPSVAEVAISGFAFSPATVTIAAGSAVKWTNMDAAGHDVKFDSFTSPTFGKGESYSHQFNTPGTYNYICGIHPSMKGVVVVQ